MMNRSILISLFALLSFYMGHAQQTPFNVQLQPVDIQGLGGLQSFAFGTHNGKWLIIGGRLDGLHMRQPFASFDEAGHNKQLLVVDPVAKKSWSAATSELSVSLQEQLSSTNMEFHQDGDVLYLVGGYSLSASLADHVTHDKLCAIKVPEVIDAIISAQPFANYFRQISDESFAVTGGRLLKIYDTYNLVGGQKFEGPYNPMGPNHGPGFVQEYTNSVRRFKIIDDGVNLSVVHLPSFVDSDQLHRRDYNVVPQIMPNGEEGLTAFSGVFQKTVDLPYLNCVNVDSAGYTPVNSFSQYYNHYHCPFIPLFDEFGNEMHNVFFGGIAQFYDSLGILVQDNNVPFVNTIARVTRDADGNMAEYKLPAEMPGLLGAGAEFIPLDGLPVYENGVIKLNALVEAETMIGYIYGGISSSARNIFWINTGSESTANARIYEVWLNKNSSNTHTLNTQSNSSFQLQVFPNPNNGVFSIKFQVKRSEPLWLTMADSSGKQVFHEKLENLYEGEHIIRKEIKNLTVGSQYTVTLDSDSERATVKTIVQE